MAVSVRAAGTWAAATTQSPSYAIPGGYQAGDLGILVSAWKPFGTTATVNQGWSEIYDNTGGSTANGNGTGSSRLYVAYKVLTASETNPTVTRSTAVSPGGGVIIVLQKAAGEVWDIEMLSAAVEQAMGSTAMSHSLTTTVAVQDTDWVFAFTAVADESATFTRATTAISGASVTWNGNVVEYPATHLSSTAGNDMAADLIYRAVTTGAASGASITVTATLSAAERVGSVLFRVGVDAATDAPAEVATATGAAYNATATTGGGGGSTCLLVVADSAAPTTTDAALKTRIEALGHTVTYRSDEATADLTKDFIVIAESVSSGNVAAKYSTFAGGVLVLEGGLVDDMDMSSAASTNAGTGDTTVDILDDTHALADGNTGTGVTVLSSSSVVNYSTDTTLAGSVESVVSRPGVSASVIIYGYESGATMQASHVAEGRRAFFGLAYDAEYSKLNATGLGLLDAAITWVAPASSGTNAAAGVATSTGAANQPAASVAPAGGIATATGAAHQPVARVAPNAAIATATGAAAQPSESLGPTAQVATATGAANTATGVAAKSAPAEVATATGAANAAAPSVGARPGLAAATGAASGVAADIRTAGGIATATGAALDATVSTATATNANAEVASATGAALAIAASVAAAPGLATASAAAIAASARIAGTAATASASGAAHAPSVSVAPRTGVATATGEALDATVSTVAATTADAGTASATAAAAAPTPATAGSAATATATGAALDATVTTVPAIDAPAESAGATADAREPALAIATAAASASATGTALDATVSTASAVDAVADVASAVGQAHDARVAISPSAVAAAAIAVAFAPSVAVAPIAAVAIATGQGRDAQPGIAPAAQQAAATAEALLAATNAQVVVGGLPPTVHGAELRPTPGQGTTPTPTVHGAVLGPTPGHGTTPTPGGHAATLE